MVRVTRSAHAALAQSAHTLLPVTRDKRNKPNQPCASAQTHTHTHTRTHARMPVYAHKTRQGRQDAALPFVRPRAPCTLDNKRGGSVSQPAEMMHQKQRGSSSEATNHNVPAEVDPYVP